MTEDRPEPCRSPHLDSDHQHGVWRHPGSKQRAAAGVLARLYDPRQPGVLADQSSGRHENEELRRRSKVTRNCVRTAWRQRQKCKG